MFLALTLIMIIVYFILCGIRYSLEEKRIDLIMKLLLTLCKEVEVINKQINKR